QHHYLHTFPTRRSSDLYWEGVTKMDLLIYLRNIFPYMFPHMKERALTIIRCPEGVEDTCFFQKHVPDYVPKFMKRTDEKIVCNQDRKSTRLNSSHVSNS